jgi:hypothetical protein
MRLGVIDVLFGIGCIAVGAALGQWLAPDLPASLGLLAETVAGVSVYFALVYPFYRSFRLLPIILPRCPCCAKNQQGFDILGGHFPRIAFRCVTCNGEFAVWLNGTPGDQETWEKPVLALKWPYALGRYRRMPPETGAAPENQPPP